MTARIRVGVVFGGRSGEHDVSLASAASIVGALDRARFEVVPLAITREGRWLPPVAAPAALGSGAGAGGALAVWPGARDLMVAAGGPVAGGAGLADLDVIFPVVHGPNGEDGTMQGLLEMCGIPYVGAGVLGSAVGMDKVIQKDVLSRNGLPVAEYLLVRRADWEAAPEAVCARVAACVGLPCFVKPCNLGSSVGISKVRAAEGLPAALAAAAAFDRRMICERAVDAREVECAVLGNDVPEASVPGEILSSHEFYDYDAKYMPGKSRLIIPADLPPAAAEQIRALAIRVFTALDCAGMARVDFFVERGTGAVLVNELNTIPGFTQTSMYPKLWEGSGLPYPDLLARLIELALERHGGRRATGGAAEPSGGGAG